MTALACADYPIFSQAEMWLRLSLINPPDPIVREVNRCRTTEGRIAPATEVHTAEQFRHQTLTPLSNKDVQSRRRPGWHSHISSANVGLALSL